MENASNHHTARVSPHESRRSVGGARVCIRNDNRKWLYTGFNLSSIYALFISLDSPTATQEYKQVETHDFGRYRYSPRWRRLKRPEIGVLATQQTADWAARHWIYLVNLQTWEYTSRIVRDAGFRVKVIFKIFNKASPNVVDALCALELVDWFTSFRNIIHETSKSGGRSMRSTSELDRTCLYILYMNVWFSDIFYIY